MSERGQPRSGGRQIAQLALPALGVLAAEPPYLLFDTAVVGRLGALSLAGLAIGGLTLGLVGSDLTFLSAGFLPPICLSLVLDWGLAGIWSGLSMLIVLRLIFVGWRARWGRWMRTGQ